LLAIAGGSFYGGFARQLEIRAQPHVRAGHVVVIKPTPQVLQWQQNPLAAPDPARLAALSAPHSRHHASTAAQAPTPAQDRPAPSTVQAVAAEPAQTPAAASDAAVSASDPPPTPTEAPAAAADVH
jgi:hypothetical protein